MTQDIIIIKIMIPITVTDYDCRSWNPKGDHFIQIKVDIS